MEDAQPGNSGTGPLTGNYAHLFFISDADPMWNEAKSIKVTTTMDAAFHDHSVDLSTVPGCTGRIA